MKDFESELRSILANEIQDGQPTHRARGNIFEQVMALVGDKPMRDYFAGQALVGMGDRRFDPSEEETATQIKALAAYSIADAMIAERSKGEQT